MPQVTKIYFVDSNNYEAIVSISSTTLCEPLQFPTAHPCSAPLQSPVVPLSSSLNSFLLKQELTTFFGAWQ